MVRCYNHWAGVVREAQKQRQQEAFQEPAHDTSHVFLASTVAESSVTLPKVPALSI